MSQGIAPLVSMLRDTQCVAGPKIAATALARLAVTDENRLQIAQSGGIDVLIVQVLVVTLQTISHLPPSTRSSHHMAYT